MYIGLWLGATSKIKKGILNIAYGDGMEDMNWSELPQNHICW